MKAVECNNAMIWFFFLDCPLLHSRSSAGRWIFKTTRWAVRPWFKHKRSINRKNGVAFRCFSAGGFWIKILYQITMERNEIQIWFQTSRRPRQTLNDIHLSFAFFSFSLFPWRESKCMWLWTVVAKKGIYDGGNGKLRHNSNAKWEILQT